MGITTTYAGRSAIAPGSGDQHAAFVAAVVGIGDNHAGFTLAEAVVRLTAAGAPLWSRRIGTADYSWCVRKPSTPRGKARGTVHVFAHRAAAGALESCAGNHGDGIACKATAASIGDGVARWRTDADANGDADVRIVSLDAKSLMSAFVTAFGGHVDYLRARGHGETDMLDTPGIAQRIAAIETVAGKAAADKVRELLADAPRKASKPSKANKSSKAKASK